jgi:hypothetical protein
LTPVHVANCTLQRYGNANDGGYLMCAEAVATAQALYSYGIDGRDEWGCAVSRATSLTVHQYDCFNTAQPPCDGGSTMFHAECVGPEAGSIDGRPFGTIADHIRVNGDAGKRLVIKMDVEGSEWRSLVAAPAPVLAAIDQIAIEFHGVEQAHFLETVEHLKNFFHVAHVHQNNYECLPGFDPFPGPVVEALLVNKRLAVVDPSVDARPASPLDAPNNPSAADCQGTPGGSSELQRLARWMRRYATGAVRLARRSLLN